MHQTTVTLHVNGDAHTLTLQPRELLVDVLRDRLGLTGTHVGCEHGICGACTISIDGEPGRACIIFAVQAEGRQIRTVEGVQDEEVVARLRDAFSRHHALQCGFCTPGFVMLGRWALTERRAVDKQRITDVVSSNLCRCGCYQGIRAAFREVAGTHAEDDDAERPDLDAPAR